MPLSSFRFPHSIFPVAKRAAAFTLAETLVAVAVFSTLMVIIVGSYISLTSSSRTARAQQTILDNLNAALEHVGRVAESAEIIWCGNDLPATFFPTEHQECPDGGNSIAVVRDSENGDVVVFRFDTNQGILFRSLNGAYEPITTPSAFITAGAFFVQSAASSNVPPQVIVHMRGVAQVGDALSDFSLQTAVTPPLAYVIPENLRTGTATSTVGVSSVPQCPLAGMVGVEIHPDVGFAEKTAFSFLGANDIYNHRDPVTGADTGIPLNRLEFDISENPIPAGTYTEVYVGAWDNHCEPQDADHTEPCDSGRFPNLYAEPFASASREQIAEQLRVAFYDSGGNLLWESPRVTSDIGHYVNYSDDPADSLVSNPGEPIVLSSDVTKVVVFHAGGECRDYGQHGGSTATCFNESTNGRSCYFRAGMPKTPDNYICDPDNYPNWSFHSVVVACLGVVSESGDIFPRSDIERIRARPF